MYIAFRWLLGLNIAMWLAMCCLDFVMKYNRKIEIMPHPVHKEFYNAETIEAGYQNSSETILIKSINEGLNLGHNGTSILALMHYITFFAGIITVTIFNRKREILSHTKTVVRTSKSYLMEVYRKNAKDINVNDSLINIRISASKYWNSFLTHVKSSFNKLKSTVATLKAKKDETQRTLNSILVNKLKEVVEERKFLGQLLTAAIYENRNIRTQYQLENMARNRLVRHVDDSKKLIKENRSKYVSFQQLYLVTHKENIFLKSRIVKLTKDKEDAEQNLLGLVNEVYRSKNKELKAYCTRFVVNTEKNLLHLDPKTEIKKFLQKSIQPSSGAVCESPSTSHIEIDPPRSCLNSPLFRHILNENSKHIAFISESPKLRGLPGEYVWTVKDKEGIIEKLYECAYESDHGDIVQRIREYSVYYDKECLLDFNHSETVIDEVSNDTDISTSRHFNVDFPIASKGFLTGSEAFQKFMTRIRNVVSFSSAPVPPITYK